jgi:3-oxoacyl-[acyl-carrier-protein] synthase-1
MATPLGFETNSTVAAVKAGISAYQLSEFDDTDGNMVKMAHIAEDAYMSFEAEIDEGDYYNDHYDHVIKLALVAIQEAISGQTFNNPLPLLVGLPEPVGNVNLIPRDALMRNILRQNGVPVFNEHTKTFATGRASGIHAIETAQRYFATGENSFVLLGASDSYYNFSRIRHLAQDKRLLTEASDGGFTPGESAGFILLTNRLENAMINNGHVVVLNSPGISDEPGHLYSNEPNTGEGLDRAFKVAMSGMEQNSIGRIYTSLNGENFWAKELGVATIRNSEYFTPEYRVEHPAEFLGDMGAATAPVLIGLAAIDLLDAHQAGATLVYSSSDYSSRAAVSLECLAT